AFLFFEIFGYNPVALAAMLTVFIPITVSLKVSEGVISSIVLILHVYTSSNFTLELLKNELALMTIGYSIGLLVNVYMPDITKKLVSYRKQVEQLYAEIFEEIAKYLRNGDTLWDGHQLIEAEKLINKAKALAFQDVENHLTRKNNLHYVYFDMRERQLEIIERVLPKITTLPVIVQQAEIVAVFMEELSSHVHSGNTASVYRDKLQLVKEQFADMPLPTDYTTFTAMASLYQFIEEMDAYLAIKQSFKGMH
ncbi:MAG: aromatic acid exporter family protein, partial [Lysinibacillus sp.]